MDVFGYCRVSTAKQEAEGYSLEEQKCRIEAYCRALGWNLRHVFVDGGESGAKLDRPALTELCGRVTEAQKVVVYKLDRLSRSQKDTLYLIEDVFLKNGTDFVSITENFDTSTPFGRAIVGILAVFAQLERDQIRERLTMGKVARAREGRYSGNPRAAIGYDYIDGELVVNENERPQVELLFDLCLKGYNFEQIAGEMNARGYSHKFGHWQRYTVARSLRNPVYCGKVSFSGELFAGVHEPIISEELFDQVQNIREERSRVNKNYGQRAGTRAKSYLSGLLYCAKCGQKYYTRNDHGTATRYVCFARSNGYSRGLSCSNNIWVKTELEDLVFGEIKKLALDPPAAEKAKKPRDYDAELARLDSQLSRLLDLYALGNFPVETLNEKTATLNARRLEILNEKKETPPDRSVLLRSFADVLENGTVQEVRAVLFAIIERIELDGEKVRIFWRF